MKEEENKEWLKDRKNNSEGKEENLMVGRG